MQDQRFKNNVLLFSWYINVVKSVIKLKWSSFCQVLSSYKMVELRYSDLRRAYQYREVSYFDEPSQSSSFPKEAPEGPGSVQYVTRGRNVIYRSATALFTNCSGVCLRLQLQRPPRQEWHKARTNEHETLSNAYNLLCAKPILI